MMTRSQLWWSLAGCVAAAIIVWLVFSGLTPPAAPPA